MKHAIYDQYGIRMERKIAFRQYEAFWSNRVLYVVTPVSHLEQTELDELQALSEYMIHQQKDIYVSSFVKNKEEKICCDIEGKNIALLRVPYRNVSRNIPLGSELASFHAKSRRYPAKINVINRIGQWKSLWERRLDQMESFYYQKVSSSPTDVFDQMFVESFPYYLGLAENAIQYLVDAEMDDQPHLTDAASICHHRFTTNSWHQQEFVKFPLDWVVDHSTRDIAEWVRSEFHQSKNFQAATIQTFMRDYEGISRLSSFSWRLLYARLIFPIQYLECVENYYTLSSVSDKQWHEERLQAILHQSDRYEKLLHSFFDISQAPTRNMKIPLLDWV